MMIKPASPHPGMRGPVIQPSAYAGKTYRGPVELLDLYVALGFGICIWISRDVTLPWHCVEPNRASAARLPHPRTLPHRYFLLGTSCTQSRVRGPGIGAGGGNGG